MSTSLRHFPPRDGDGDARWTALCFAHAGAGTTPFAPWRRSLPDWVDLFAFLAPGREERQAEPALRCVEALVADAMPDILGLASPLVLIGHSFGACLAFEVAHTLVACGRPPGHLVILGAAAPGHRSPPRIDDDRGIEETLMRLGADTSPLARPEVRAMILPSLRADFAAQIAYWPLPRDPLPVPVSVFYGQDDPSMTAEDAHAWKRACSEDCEVMAVRGGHFFPRECRDVVIAAVIRRLSPLPSTI
jgi:pyochelin biosynthetic protein PchC